LRKKDAGKKPRKSNMELSGETLIAADRRAVWAALNDDAVLAA
jgi:hypothetical protein